MTRVKWMLAGYVDGFGIEDTEIAPRRADSVTVGQLRNDASLPQEGPFVLLV